MVRLLTTLFLLLISPALTLTAHAQANEPSVYLRVRSPQGDVVPDACFTFVDFSNEGCDDNSDGFIRYQGIPAGDYTVRQTQAAEGYLTAGDFPVRIETSIHDRIIEIVLTPGTATPGAAADIAVRAFDPGPETYTAAGCLILHGGSIEGCDDNGDGSITFVDVTPGSYLVEETLTPEGVIPLIPQWIGVSNSGDITVERVATGPLPAGGTSTVDILTRDAGTGSLIPGACYIIENASIEGCDENGDGAVQFEDVPMGVYTLRQTTAPAGYDLVPPFWIDLTTLDTEQPVVVRQADTQHRPGHRNVSIRLYDSGDVTHSTGQVCLQLVGASLEGCDDNGDGQIDFLDVPVGNWPIEFTQLPPGYEPALSAYEVSNPDTNPFSIVVQYVGLSSTS